MAYSHSTSFSMFWSGYRLDRWARDGKTNAGTQVTPEAQRVAAGDGGSAGIGGDVWASLYKALTRLHQSRPPGQSDEAYQESLGQAVDNFFSDNPVPQAGDMLVYDSNNAISGGSHNNLVERYDAATRTIYTIGGIEGHAVGGRRVVLTDRFRSAGWPRWSGSAPSSTPAVLLLGERPLPAERSQPAGLA